MSEKQRRKTEPTSEKKEIAPAKPRRRPSSMLEPYRPPDLWMEFDRAFERFRRDFESMLWSPHRLLERELPVISGLESNLPSVDLEDKGDRYALTAEVPGFKKEDITIHVGDDMVEISGCRETKSDKEAKGYVKKERMSESFERKIRLPEEIKIDDVKANLTDGVLELELPKKAPKYRKQIQIK